MFGALIQDYSHQPDLAFWILGKIPTAVHARGLTTRRPELWAEPNVLSVDSLYAASDGLVSAAFADATVTSLQTGEPAALASLEPEDTRGHDAT